MMVKEAKQSVDITTQMLRIILSGKQPQQLTRGQRIVSSLWLFGAILIIGTYIVIPVLIVSQQLHLLFNVIPSAICLTLAEGIVSLILWKTGHPSPARSALPRLQPASPMKQKVFSLQDVLPLLPTSPLPSLAAEPAYDRLPTIPLPPVYTMHNLI